MKKIVLSIVLFSLIISCASACENKNQTINPQTIVWKNEVDEKTKEYRSIYKKARELENKKSYQAAYELYKTIEDKYKLLNDIILYRKSEVAKNIPNESAVIANLKKLLEKCPYSQIKDIALYSLGQCYTRLNDPKNSEIYYQKVIDEFPQSNYATGSKYYLAHIYSNDPEKKERAIEYLKEYLQEAPDGTFSINCIDELNNLTGESNLSKEDKELLGIAYYKNSRYQKAIQYLKDDINHKNWFALGDSYYKTNQTEKTINTFKQAINNLTGLDPDEVDNAIKLTAKIKGNSYNAWQQCENIYPNYADVGLYFMAKKLYDPQAIPLYQKIVDNFPNSNYAPEANWKLFWHNFSKGNYQTAINIADRHTKTYALSKSTPKIIFWTGKIYEKTNKNASAATIYRRLQKHYPGNYYTYRAIQRLEDITNKKTDNLWKTDNTNYQYSKNWNPPLPYSLIKISQKFGAQFAELLYLDDHDDALLLSKELDPTLESYFLLKKGSYNQSIVKIRDNQKEFLKYNPEKETSWETLYPLHFATIIYKNALKNNIDPLLVQALTREESYFNPQAISSSKARGLMQLLLPTAKDVARWEKLKDFNQYDLFKPETNIQLGTRYLKYTHDRFSGNSMLAVAAYNGGPGNVSKWLNTYSTSDWDVFVENIPLSETRKYVEKVFTSYWNYKSIYKVD